MSSRDRARSQVDLARSAEFAPGVSAAATRRPLGHVGEDLHDLGRVERLLLDEGVGQAVERLAVHDEDVAGLVVGLVDEQADLGVDLGRHVVGVVGLVADVAAEEHLAVVLAELLGADLVGHAVLGDHRAGDCGGFLDVVLGAGGGIPEDRAPRPSARPCSMASWSRSCGAGREVLVRLGKGERPAQGPAPGDDRHLVDGVGVGQGVADQGVAALVVGDDPLLVVGDDPRLALGAGDDPVDRLLELRHPDLLEPPAGGEQGGFVHEVGQVGAGEARGAAGQHVDVDALGQRLALGVHVEDRPAAFQVGTVDDDLAVEAARAQQGRVEDVGTVRGGDQDDARLGVEPVHLDEELVEGLLPFVVAAAQAGPPVAADGVDLVDEHDGRGRRLGLLEQVAHP